MNNNEVSVWQLVGSIVRLPCIFAMAWAIGGCMKHFPIEGAAGFIALLMFLVVTRLMEKS